ncbi:hypothetical protein PLESTB_001255400 [Pleodorina starrii]|uniref:DNA topoisomerase 2 n=1 Tax=Pleodorina starrii TaxID=330485 RepID=A0A9W6F5X9_9CHLO|nr:hypothetical protein PLESTM_000204600 [Pleodorina starrii]GLC57702.1 hypothetical protein PLESTB_001255400 [Pleodorina starrii]GLC63371.1 hypothetical protein PLESTF_000029200 [Pleodorina starrii]
MRGCAGGVGAWGATGRSSRCAPLPCARQHCKPCAQPGGWTRPDPTIRLASAAVGPSTAPSIPAAKKPRTSAPEAAAVGIATLSQEDYGASSIQVLEGLEPVRKRPGMYIGGTGSEGLHHLIWEVVDNSVDEVQAGHATRLEVDVDLDSGWVVITDDGRGIPVDVHPATGKSALETVLTVLHAGGKFGGENSGYKVSGGLHGVGISVVNALSEEVAVTVWRCGVRYSQRYSRGAPLEEVRREELAPDSEDAERTGTQVRFLYDRSIFAADVSYSPDVIATRLHELAFLNPAATIRFRASRRGKAVPGRSKYLSDRAVAAGAAAADGDGGGAATSTSAAAAAALGKGGRRGRRRTGPGSGSGIGGEAEGEAGGDGAAAAAPPAPMYGIVRQDGPWQVFQFSGGLREFVGCLQSSHTPLHEAISVYRSDPSSGVGVAVALQWAADSYREEVRGFANSIATVDGGTHLDGLRAALTRTVTALGRKMKLVKDSDPPLSGEHIREGLGAVISVQLPNPEFEGQTKTRLGNPEVRRIVEAAVAESVGEWLEAHPAALSALLGKALTAARAADAARKARELVRRKTSLSRSMLPGKLADCASEDRERTEIYLVEGDSAGGSAKQARDRKFQAVLPLKGKILNVERVTGANEAAMYKNAEIASLIVALGLGTERAPPGAGLSAVTRGSVGDSSGEEKAGRDEKALEGLRYGKVVILTDADVDGAHIRTLLLTFLFRYRPQLFYSGHVYVAVPPLYKVERGKSVWWAHTEEELRRLVSEAGLAPGSYSVQRFKGLGEMMPQQLWDTTLNPETRLLRRLTVRDAAEADSLLSALMGSHVAPRKALIEEYANRLESIAALDV